MKFKTLVKLMALIMAIMLCLSPLTGCKDNDDTEILA